MPRSAISWTRMRIFTLFSLGLVISILTLVLIIMYNDTSSSSASLSDLRQDPGTLLFVQTVFRHGDRTPGNAFPLDPYKDGRYFPEGWGALTKTGKQRLISLGRTLRARYSDFLPETYLSKQVYVLSSAADRCIMSAQCLLAGLYPPTQQQSIEPHLGWQPIPVHSSPRELDKVVAAKRSCKSYDKALRALYSSQEIQTVNMKNADLYAVISKGSGLNITSVAQAEGLYNTLYLQQTLNLSLPSWATDKVMSELHQLAVLSLQLFTQTPFMIRIRAGPLLGEICTRMEKQDSKLFLVSGHDLTLINLLRGLGFTDKQWKPDFAAFLVFELHAHSLGNIVKILYSNGHEVDKLKELELSNCSSPCRLSTFLKVLKSKVPDHWEEECERNVTSV